MSYKITISSGDFNGIGPEVVIKTLSEQTFANITPIILSSKSVIDRYNKMLTRPIAYHHTDSINDIAESEINLLESYEDVDPSIKPGAFTKQSGKCAMLAVEKGLTLCKNDQADALVTAPISKEAVNLAGYNIPGHTEFLAEHTNTNDFMMMLVHEDLRVGLASIHIPLKEVPARLSKEVVGEYIETMHRSLRRNFNISKPKIAVLGLNPHAGDGGVIGTEEIDFIAPALETARAEGMDISGPHPADGFFGNRKYNNYDAVLAMYHDQGLIPFKTISFGSGVNFTAGLPIIRTSPDHGTAFDIAGENRANPSSFDQAFSLAVELAQNRKKESIS